MRGFREALGYGDLLDLGFQGPQATWWNSETQLRLDRAVCTPTWCDIFGFARLMHLPPSDSDHVPILLQASTVPLAKRPRHHRFKFEAHWLQHGECDGVVKQAWQTDVYGHLMYQLTENIFYTRMKLDAWQKKTFKGRQMTMLGIRARLEELLDVNLTTSVLLEKKQLMEKLQTLLSQEESFWKQRAKVTWLKEGDRNTSFFHRKTANRKRKNVIHGLFDEQGDWCEDDEGVERVVTSYFTHMFTASNIDEEGMAATLEAIQPCDEVKCALFQMYPTKSPGPDGMPPLFFQHYWELIGDEVTKAVQSFLHSANKLKRILPELISPYQSAFVPERLITDNILVDNELAHFVHNKREGGDGYMTLKLDLSKAYDRMEWTFLRKVIERFGFASIWIEMVMQCVCSVRYSFLVREGFSSLLQQKQALGLLPGIAICREAPLVNHLLFADDSMLYAKASLEDCYQIQDVIETYGRASGRKKTATFQYIKENLAKKVSNWQDLEQLCTKFWWGSTLDKRKIHWKTWKALCNPKEEGGMAHFGLLLLTLLLLILGGVFSPQGMFWQIGDGAMVNIWTDSWIPGVPDFRPCGGNLAATDLNLVSDLIHHTESRNVSLINRVFLAHEVEAILSIPLSSREVTDRVIWRFTKHGKFTVKIAYRFSFSTSPSCSPFDLFVGVSFWKKLWKVVIPNSAKVHIWRVYHNILPSLERLASKRVVLESMTCPLCMMEIETTIHLCRDCSFTKQVLQTNGILAQVCYNPHFVHFDLLEWLSSCATELSLELLGILVYLLRGVWKERNSRVWENKIGTVDEVVLKAMSRLHDFRSLNVKTEHNRVSSTRTVRWTALPLGYFKVNVDGSFHQATKNGSIGFVNRDWQGTFLAGGGMSLSGLLSPEHVEALACN
ncbi:uncharacterized protein LOC133726094 [Rosa rugosa]|uniref:uncharacterized protein LOC133726094 n=1 Tax=Rosa rugosa TaxID=74645 RepID=UPI002B40A9CC|nr:uncharacterized protein LOC133726094 [Rosa rugosa]